MARKGYGRHSVVATGNNDPTRQISKDAWNDDIDNTGMFGFSKSASTIVISSGNLTPVDTWTVVESETSPTADDLANILTTETSTEDLLFLVAKTGDIITLKHQATGTGQIHNLSQGDKTLSETVPTMLVRIGTDWYEFGGGGSFTPSSTDTLTNKTLGATTIAGHLIPDTDVAYDLGSTSFKFRDLYLSGSSIKLGDATITASNSTIVLPSGSTISGGSGDVVDLNSSQTLTNKTLTAPIISSISNTGTLTLPTSTDTLVGKATTDTLTNKTINGDNNTISNLAHGSEVDNPSSGVHGVTGNVVGTSDTQTLTNKILTNPTLGASYLDMDMLATPSDPSTGTARFYVKTIDGSNEGLFIKIKQAGSIVEVQIV